MSAVAIPASKPSFKASWICLAIAWICFLVPVPGLGLFIGWPLNFVAFILAIIAMSKGGASAGIGQLLSSLIVSPIIYFVGLAVFAGTLGAAAEAGVAEQEAQREAVRAEAPVATLTAKELFAAYEANEIAADARFKGKRLVVSGVVEAIDSGVDDLPRVRLEAGDFASVNVADLPVDDAATLQKGEHVTVLCTSEGEMMGFPVLGDCALQ